MAKFDGAVLEVGTDAAPIVTENGEAVTITHNYGVRAKQVVVLAATSRALNITATMVVTQPTVNTIVVSNGTGGQLSNIVRAVFRDGGIGETDVIALADSRVVVV